jgi:hypothetical protein
MTGGTTRERDGEKEVGEKQWREVDEKARGVGVWNGEKAKKGGDKGR